ncbi:NAD-dependent epimerase/dehydratase family protein [Mesorhizobium sp. L-8-3]|uniref:NAD-dependent epimerase/dehydratase family protein n=1 Tax=Mesorhizobium sp. L-8-3 TaxID=2744522 RepID=UPI001925D46D|nr:NAD-dependent epimerase/dehydratase family protein [Mesorhizobium sp. L-8-3]BCH26083.1 epimerase [Mesorhizobium sp. L-8-3]
MADRPAKVLLTGASGFVGRATLAALARRGLAVRAVSRSGITPAVGSVEWRQGDLSFPEGWDRLLEGIDVVVHLAGNAGRGSKDEMMRANAEATAMLAKAAAAAGVARFVYASSIRVYGHQGRIDAESRPAPADAYGRSKLQAEAALQAETGQDRMACSVLRPPFVFGADRAGLLSLMVRAARYRLPLPLAALKNRRSLLYLDNLADLFAAASLEPAALGSFRLPAGEGLDLTYGELFARIGEALGRRAMSFPVSSGLLTFGGALLLSRETLRRMMEDCVVDGTVLADRLGWKPPVTPTQALSEVALRN